MRNVLLSFTVIVVLALAGCSGPSLKDYSLVRPVASREPLFEDDDLKVSMSIVEDCKFLMEITNKTPKNLKVTWGNSSVVAAGGREDRLFFSVLEPAGQASDTGGITSVGPGKTVKAEVYPATHVYTDSSGREHIYPLFYNGCAKGRPKDLKGKEIGVNLVLEVNDHTRRYPIMIGVRP